MPFNGSGGTSQPASSFYPAVPSTLIESAKWNITAADIYSMLATCLLKDGQQVATQRIPFAVGISTDTVNELTSATGVTLDSVLLKDGRIDTMQGSDIVCAATLNLETATGNVVDVTGSTGPVTAITLSQGHWRIVRFTGTPTLTHGASLVLPGGTNIVVAAGDYALFSGYAAGVVRCLMFSRASGIALKPFASKDIYGLTYANNVGDATNDIDVAAGAAIDSTGVDTITVSAITKQSDVAWAVGSGNGGLDTGAAGNSDYHIWAIKRVDTQVADVLFSLSSTAPTMPANYTLKRLIGWFKRVGGTIVAFHTYEIAGGGLEMNWDAPTLDVNLTNTLTTSRRTDAVKAPLTFSTIANLTVIITDASTSINRITCPDETDATVGAANGNIRNPVAGNSFHAQMNVRTSAAGLIAARSDTATVDTYQVLTTGFQWSRR